MSKRSYIHLATQQRMLLSRKTLIIGCSVIAIATAGITLWQLSNSERSMASTLKTEAKHMQVLATASENTGAATARSASIEKQLNAATATEKAAAAAYTTTEAKAFVASMATEEQALDIVAKQLSEDFNGRNFAVMMETPAGKVDLKTTYTYPGRPDLSRDELAALRESNRNNSAPAALTASNEAPTPDLSANDNNNGLRKFEVVSADQVAMQSVNLQKFDIKRKFNTVLLSWNTGTEKYNDFFAIEKSTDGKTFKEIGRVNGAGDYKNNLLYAFVDRNPSEGAAWYRIRQFDFSGNEKTFPAKKVK